MAATTFCGYLGTLPQFLADAGNAAPTSSNPLQGTFLPGTSALASLNAAVVAGYVVQETNVVQTPIVSGVVNQQQWILQTGGVL